MKPTHHMIRLTARRAERKWQRSMPGRQATVTRLHGGRWRWRVDYTEAP